MTAHRWLLALAIASAFTLAQSQVTGKNDPKSVYAPYVYPDLTARIQVVGGIFTACFFAVIAIFVTIRDFLKLYDFGTVRTTIPLEPGQLKRALTALSAAYLAPQEGENSNINTGGQEQQPIKASLQSDLSHPLSQVTVVQAIPGLIQQFPNAYPSGYPVSMPTGGPGPMTVPFQSPEFTYGNMPMPYAPYGYGAPRPYGQ